MDHSLRLPLVYTENPINKKHNLGIYRMQVYDTQTTGFTGRFKRAEAFITRKPNELGQSLPVTVFLGGPPALILAAIAPLPEDVPELVLASLLAGEKLKMTKNPLDSAGAHRLAARGGVCLGR